MARLTGQKSDSQYDDTEGFLAYIQSWLDNVDQPSLPGSEYGEVDDRMPLPQTPIKSHKQPLHTPSLQHHPPTSRPGKAAKIITTSPSGYSCSFKAPRAAVRQDRLAFLPTRRQERSTTSDIENIPPGAKLIFEKRSRRKTRRDRYDTKHQRESRAYERPLSRQQRKAKKQEILKSRKETMKNFSSAAVRDQNLIMKPNLTSSLFLNGRGSVITPLADLTFNEMSFSAATRNREHINKTNPSTDNNIENNRQDQIPATDSENAHRNTKRKRAESPSQESSLVARSPPPGETSSDSQCLQASDGPTHDIVEADRGRINKNAHIRDKESISSPINWSSSNRKDMNSIRQTGHGPSSNPNTNVEAPFTSEFSTANQPPVQYADKALSPIWDSFDVAGLEKQHFPAQPQLYSYTYCHPTLPEMSNPDLEITTSNAQLFNMSTNHSITPALQYITDNRDALQASPQPVMNEAATIYNEPSMDFGYSQNGLVALSKPLTEFDMEMRAFWRPNVYM